MVKKCRNFGVKNIFVSGLVYTKRIKIEIIEDLHKKLVSVCKEMQVHFIDNGNICGFNLFKDGLHLLDSGKRLLANNFIFKPVSLTESLYTYNDDINEVGNHDVPCDTPLTLKNPKLKNKNRLILGHLNINSLAGKLDQLQLLIGKNIDILVITDTKIDSSFPKAQFKIEGFSMPFRIDRNRIGGEVLNYVREDITRKQLTKHKLPDDIEGIFIEINLRKIKWLLFGSYHSPQQ